MGAIRKPRFSNCDVEKAMDGFFNNILAACPKTLFFDRLRTVQGCTVIFDGCKPLKMGVIRKPRFSNCDVEKATDGFIQQYTSIRAQSDRYKTVKHYVVMVSK